MNEIGLHTAKRFLCSTGIAVVFVLVVFAPAHSASSFKPSPEGRVGIASGPTVSIDDVIQVEGTNGSTAFVFTVTVTNPNSQAVLVDFGTSNGTANGTVTGDFGDYAITSGTLKIPAFGTSASLVVRVTADTYAESDETFFVNLTNAENAKIDDGQGQGTILNDDGAPVAGVDQGSVTDFTLGRVMPTPSQGTARVEFSLPRPSPIRLTVLDLQGREVAVLAEGHYSAGRHQGIWNGRAASQAAPAGVYFIRYQTPNGNRMSRIVLER